MQSLENIRRLDSDKLVRDFTKYAEEIAAKSPAKDFGKVFNNEDLVEGYIKNMSPTPKADHSKPKFIKLDKAVTSIAGLPPEIYEVGSGNVQISNKIGRYEYKTNVLEIEKKIKLESQLDPDVKEYESTSDVAYLDMLKGVPAEDISAGIRTNIGGHYYVIQMKLGTNGLLNVLVTDEETRASELITITKDDKIMYGEASMLEKIKSEVIPKLRAIANPVDQDDSILPEFQELSKYVGTGYGDEKGGYDPLKMAYTGANPGNENVTGSIMPTGRPTLGIRRGPFMDSVNLSGFKFLFEAEKDEAPVEEAPVDAPADAPVADGADATEPAPTDINADESFTDGGMGAMGGDIGGGGGGMDFGFDGGMGGMGGDSAEMPQQQGTMQDAPAPSGMAQPEILKFDWDRDALLTMEKVISSYLARKKNLQGGINPSAEDIYQGMGNDMMFGGLHFSANTRDILDIFFGKMYTDFNQPGIDPEILMTIKNMLSRPTSSYNVLDKQFKTTSDDKDMSKMEVVVDALMRKAKLIMNPGEASDKIDLNNIGADKFMPISMGGAPEQDTGMAPPSDMGGELAPLDSGLEFNAIEPGIPEEPTEEQPKKDNTSPFGF